MAIKDKNGLAILFDAMMFLTIISIISISLSGLVTIEKENDRIRYVQDVHSIVFSVTCDWCRVPGAAPVSIADVLLLDLDDEHLAMLRSQLQRLLDEYLAEQFHYSLSISSPHFELMLGEECASSGDRLVSARDLGVQLHSELSAW